MNTIFSDGTKTPEEIAAEHKAALQSKYASQYEWAVQHYEAGQYEEAIQGFEKLSEDGSIVDAFQTIPYYLGMSYFYTQQSNRAIEQLEKALRNPLAPTIAQDARIHLLELYEKQHSWDALVALAAETDKTNLYEDNRVLLKLLWANALNERGEFQGAKQILKDAKDLLDNQPPSQANNQVGSPEKDLFGRYTWTELKVILKQCNGLPIHQSSKKKQPLFSPWGDAIGLCFEQALNSAIQELYFPESAWLEAGNAELNQSWLNYSTHLQALFHDPKLSLKTKEGIQSKARQNYYVLLHRLEKTEKELPEQSQAKAALVPLKKQLDHLIFALSIPSS